MSSQIAGFLAMAYPWLKSLHVISVMLWMGAQLLLPSLLAAHHGLAPASPQAVLLTHIERRLINRVMNPAMLAAFLFGALLAGVVIDSAGHLPRWLGLKLGFVFVLAALHGKLLRQFQCAEDRRAQWTHAGYRFVQWIDLMLAAGVVALVVARPLT